MNAHRDPATHPLLALAIALPALFTKRRAYVEAAGMPWYILSAKYGLVDPATPIAKYDATLNSMSATDRRAWGERVLRQLREQVGNLDGITFELHAGARYATAIEDGLWVADASIEKPLAHKGLGHQLAWYGRNPSPRALDG